MIDSIKKLKAFFNTSNTSSIVFRKNQLLKLKTAVIKHEQELYEALYKDLKKNKEEVWVTEIGFFLTELNHTINNLKTWMKPKKVRTNLLNLPSSSYIYHEPLGVVLIIAPWNYPFQLLFTPLIGAIAAGNCVVLKPSEFTPATSSIMKKIIEETFDENYILYIEGDGATVVPEMMNNFIFDHVFYTGSTAVGKIIYQLAAKNLVPVTLELGGKSPCVVDETANIKIAAKRIALTKYSNCGQMCVAPDYVLVHESVKEELVEELKKYIQQFYDVDSAQSYHYGKIINEKQIDRIVKYLDDGKIIFGGNYDKEKLYIQPTLLEVHDVNSSIMQDEIFGPLLPIVTYTLKEQAVEIINKNPNPLAFYIFGTSKNEQEYWLQKIPAGGACVNNASLHLTNHHLPFGGRGFSGLGNYHGKFSFKTFSHAKAVLKTPNWFDPSMKYPPFKGKLGLFKKIIR
ncbi:MAG: aldehyde dehydrogenase [Chitinophagaceae bacterium]|nr:aldehyde dehydrogenase [Chitinophagaceae bacterium]